MITQDKMIRDLPITRVGEHRPGGDMDKLAIEEPLEIRLCYPNGGVHQTQNISVTMRTPGSDAELARGFLFTEGIIHSTEDIVSIDHGLSCAENKRNTVVVVLKDHCIPRPGTFERNFYTTSSCGVCGKGSIAAIRTVSAFTGHPGPEFSVDQELIFKLPSLSRRQQDTFEETGGLHACTLFSHTGKLQLLYEDVGRHNALDKLIGAAMIRYHLPLDKSVLLLSGRASFELVQKAAMVGIRIIAAIGAPSSLAVELAEEFRITLIGFLRGRRFNIYTFPNRITHHHEDQDQR